MPELQTISPDDAVRRIPARSRVLSTCYAATPDALLAAIARVAPESPGMTLLSGLVLGDHPFLDAVAAGHLQYRTWHVGGPVRSMVRSGQVAYVPMRAGQLPRWLASAKPFDVLLLRCSPPDRNGLCSLGPSVSFTRAAIDAASMVIAEIDPAFPRTHGETLLHIGEIDLAVDAVTPIPEYRSAPSSEATDRIAASIVDLLPLDPVVQVGIGAVPEAVAGSLATGASGAPRMVGLCCDTMIPLIERSAGGVARSGEPAIRAVELMGTDPLFALADGNPVIEMVPSTRCHNPRWTGSFDRFCSINSAVEIDLSGQVVSETIGSSVIAGIGGSVDFFEGANLSEGGLRIVALQAATADGRTSKVVARFPDGTPVSLGRHSVDVVVTEFGVARLTGLSLAERAEAIAAVAAPSFRDGLIEAARAR